MLNRFMVTLSRFMYGRYGVDRMFKGLAVLYLAVWVVSGVIGFFTDWYIVYYALRLIMTALFVWSFWRVLSRNLDARRRENQKYCAFVDKLFRKNIQRAITTFTSKNPHRSRPETTKPINM